MKHIYSLFFNRLSYAVIAAFSALSTPFLVFAQSKDTLQGYLLLILQFINNALLPLLFSVALLFFLINAARYFIIKGDSDAGREKAKTLALYGIGAFVLLVSLWGIVNMFVNGLGIDRSQAICPDYLGGWCENSSGDRELFFFGR